MMIRIAICDNSEKLAKRVQEYIKYYFAGMPQIQYEVLQYKSGSSMIDDLRKKPVIDILFTNVSFPGENGISIAREIREKNRRISVVFIGETDEYAIQAFEMHAAHYILLPIQQNQINDALDFILENFEVPDGRTISFKGHRGELVNINVNEIMYIESLGHILHIHTKNGGEKIDCRNSLGKIQTSLEALAANQFMSPYRGYLVNHFYIGSITPNGIILKDGATVPIVKRGFRIYRDKHMEFMSTNR